MLLFLLPAGRLSYTFGFKGPAMTVDTACSSSLVTTHLATKALWDGACQVAGSVGVNLTLVHSWTRACLRAGMLAEDGRCKTLDSSAGQLVSGFLVDRMMGCVMVTAYFGVRLQPASCCAIGHIGFGWRCGYPA